MKLKFKHQQFQADAAKAVCSVFEGQPYFSPVSYLTDKGNETSKNIQQSFFEENFTGFRNHEIISDLTDDVILENLNDVQRSYNTEQLSDKLEGRYNLTVEMETGVGKTYTYIKTMYELNKAYGWTKFIIVVPSVAIREGVYKSFASTQEHFSEDYGKKIKFFIYNSSYLNAIEHFAKDDGINVMIINSQAFNARGKDARRIYMELDEFKSRRPIDVIAATNPILIIDEPQSVEGEVTKEKLKEFNPLLTLRYSATPKARYNLVYKLDAIEAYNKKLVKKISVKGVTISGSTAANGYLYLQGINLYKDKAPTAVIEFDKRGKNGIKKEIKTLKTGQNLYELSNQLDEYKNGYSIAKIDAKENLVEFVNGIKLYIGNAYGEINEDQIRRLQIRETILSHIEKERQLFSKGIKVLSLFFIDEVAKYRQYDDNNNELNGLYADIFEEEYENIINTLQLRFNEDDYVEYLQNITPQSTHAGYFSIDKKSKKFVNSKEDKKEGGSNDTDAYDLIMKNKEQLLSLQEPVRFIFSHSALREGWDNPNVFQICTLKKSNSNDKKRQEIGRGLRLSVNQNGERMDVNRLGEAVHDINILTIIANESYEQFSKALQDETAELIADRPKEVNEDLFEGKVIKNTDGSEIIIDFALAKRIIKHFIRKDYIDDYDKLTDLFYEDKKSDSFSVPEDLIAYKKSILDILDKVYDPKTNLPENANVSKPYLELDNEKLQSNEFQELWERINTKTSYTVKFNTDDLIENCIFSIDRKLDVSRLYAIIKQGSLKSIKSKQELKDGEAFEKGKTERQELEINCCNIKYDLIGKIVEQTSLTRKSVVKILQGIRRDKFEQFKINPEDFITKISNLINEQKALIIVKEIQYNKLNDKYDTKIFSDAAAKPITNSNIIPSEKGLYNYVVYDSNKEKNFAQELDSNKEVAVYVKLPKSFYINTPVGHYSPDWAIAFHKGTVKHIYFVAETKGSMSDTQINDIEKAKIACAHEHFKAISSDKIKYDMVDSYESLIDKAMN